MKIYEEFCEVNMRCSYSVNVISHAVFLEAQFVRIRFVTTESRTAIRSCKYMISVFAKYVNIAKICGFVWKCLFDGHDHIQDFCCIFRYLHCFRNISNFLGISVFLS